MLHYDPQHVPSSTLLILRRTNCITTASGIVTLCKQPYSMQVDRTVNRKKIRFLMQRMESQDGPLYRAGRARIAAVSKKKRDSLTKKLLLVTDRAFPPKYPYIYIEEG